MCPELPSFIRRRKLLFEVRRLLLGGAPHEAFDRLSDPILSLSTEADSLRSRVVGILCREAARLADDGDQQQASRYLDRVASVDPLLAKRWRARLLADESAAVERESRERISAALSGVLKTLRKESVAEEGAAAPAFRLILDDLGEYLVPLQTEFTLGHARAGQSDFGIMADLEPLHARFHVQESFYGGHSWRVAPLASATLKLDGRAVGEEGATLSPGALLALSPRIQLWVDGLGEGASSVALRLVGEVECEGATRLLLMGRGPAGELTLGRGSGSSIRVVALEEELHLRLNEERTLRLRSAMPLRIGGAAGAEQELDGELSIRVPPSEHIDVLVGESRAGRPPYGVMLAPLTPVGGAEPGPRS